MKTLIVSIAVPVDNEVTLRDVKAILANHLFFAFAETANGNIRWDQVALHLSEELRPATA